LAQEFHSLGFENTAFHFDDDPDSDTPTGDSDDISQTDLPDDNDTANVLSTRLAPAGLDMRV